MFQSIDARFSFPSTLALLMLFLSANFAWAVTEQVRVDRDNDDAEERVSDGDMYRDSSDLEFAYDSYVGGLQIVGMRFRNVNVPQGASISNAYIEFETDETDNDPTNLIIVGQDSDDANGFANNDYNISSRTETTASVTWSPSAWNSVNELHQTPNIASIIQEIVDRPGWSANNDIVIKIKPGAGCTNGDCERTAESHDGESSAAPLLVIEYDTAPTVSSVHGACGADNLLLVEFDSAVSAAALDTSYYSLNAGTISSVTQQSSDTVVLAVSGIVPGQSYTLTANGVDSAVDFTGLTGHYFDQRDGGGSKVSQPAGLFTGNEFIRKDPQINYSWNTGTPTVFTIGSSNDDRFSIRWNGYIVPTQSGSYEFRLYSDDGMRLNFDGAEIVNDWSLHSPRYSSVSSAQTLAAGVGYTVQVEHFEHTGQAYAWLQWRRDGGAWEDVPANQLNSCAQTEVALPDPVIDYRMDENSWSSSAGDVVDSSGNANDGTARNGLSTTSTAHLCRAGDFDGVDDYIEHPTIDNTLNDTATMSFWIKTTQTGDNTGWRAPGIAGVEEAGGADDIFWGWLDASGRIGISVANDFSSKSTVAINDDVFHHVVLSRNASTGAYKIYIDGSLNQSGTIGSGVIGNSYSRIGSIEDTGGTPTYFRGQLDELKIYDSILTDAQVTALYTETRPCGLSAVAHYTFEQTSWSSGPVVIEDETGNGNTGISVGDAVTHPSGYVCKGVFIPDNSTTGTIDAINSRQDVNDVLGNNGTVMLWYRSEQDWVGSGRRTIIDASTDVIGGVNDKYFVLIKENDGRLRFALEDSNDGDFNLYTSANSIAAGTWVHLAIAWDMASRTMTIFVNGAQAATQSISSTNALGDVGEIYFGDNSSSYFSPGGSSYGRLDEIRLYDSVLTASEVSAVMAETHDCSSCTLGSFAITQPNFALACPSTRATVNVTAMCDDGTTVKTDYVGTVDLSGPATSTFYDASTAGSVVTSYTYTVGDAGVKDFYLYYNDENANVQTTAQDTTASVTSTASPGTDFRTAGFVLNLADISATCGSDLSATLTAIGQTLTGTGQECAVIEGFTGNKGLDVWFTIDATNNGAADTNQTMSIKQGSNTDSVTQSSDPDSDNVTLNFTSGVANFDINYADVGYILGLNFQHDSAPYNGSPYDALLATSSSSSLVFYPSGFSISAQNSGGIDLDSTATSGGITHVAGDSFNLTITAQCTGGTTATQYQPITSSTFQAAVVRTGPTDVDGDTVIDGAEGSFVLTGANTITSNATGISWNVGIAKSAFTDGELSNSSASYSEVGLIQLHVQDGNYFGQSVPATNIDIGRFIPADFHITQDNVGSYANGCELGGSAFTYNGQPFGYDASDLPSVTITPRNLGGIATQNYIGNFRKLSTASQLVFNGQTSWRTTPYSVTSRNPNSVGVPNYLDVTVDLDDGALATGSNTYDFTYTMPTNSAFTYDRINTAQVDPFNADFAIELTGINDGEVSTVSAAYEFVPTTNNEQRYGRAKLENAFGPETDALGIPLITQYWAGSAFVLNEEDNCTTYSSAQPPFVLSDYSGNLSNGETTPGGSGTLQGGQYVSGAGIELSAPGVGNDGSVTTTLTVPAWLRFDWDSSSAGEENPSGEAIFGQYRGHDRVIYWREITY